MSSRVCTLVLGSTSAIKAEAVELAAADVLDASAAGGGASLAVRVRVVGVDAASGVNEQPMGHAETLRGALNRLKNARETYGVDAAAGNVGGVWFVAVENGVVDLGEHAEECGAHWVDLAYVVVGDCTGAVRSINSSVSTPVPAEVVAEVVDRGVDQVTIGDVADPKLPKDPHLTLTRGVAKRATLLRSALAVALSQVLLE